MTQRDDEHHEREEHEVGSVAEEAAKLLSALQDWAGEHGSAPLGETAQRLAEGLRVAADDVGHGQECVFCPVCRTINLVRDTSPEVREHLAEAIGSLAQAATAALRHGAGGSERKGRDAQGPTKVDLDD